MNRVLLFIISCCLLSSCFRVTENDIAAQEQDIVLTYYDVSANFSSYSTYAVGDTIFVFKLGNNDEQEIDTLTGNESAGIIERIEVNMSSNGYTKVDSNPDIGISLIILDAVFRLDYLASGCGYYPGWWGWGGYYPGYGWDAGYGYGYCYPYYVPYSSYHKVGTVVLDAYDLKNKNEADSTVSALFNGFLMGYASFENQNYNYNKIINGIDEAFDQTPQFAK